MNQDTNTAIGAADDSLLLCASDLQHSAIYDNHVEMQACIRAVANRIAALASAAAQQPNTAYAALPAERDSPELCAVSRSCAGQFDTKRICASRGQAPAGADLAFMLKTARLLAELHGESVLSEQQCAKHMGIDLVSWRRLEDCFSGGVFMPEGGGAELPREDSESVLREALGLAPAPAPSVLEDAARLDWLEADESKCVFHLGKSWYTRSSYGMPYRKRASLRAAIDAAMGAARKQGVNHD